MRTWTPRMTEVDTIDRDWLAAHGRRPTLQTVADLLGLSRESIRRHRFNIERWYRQGALTGRQPDWHVRLWRNLFRSALDALSRTVRTNRRLVEQAARPKRPRRHDSHVTAYRWHLREVEWHDEMIRRGEEARLAALSRNARLAERRRLENLTRAQLMAEIENDPVIAKIDAWARATARRGPP